MGGVPSSSPSGIICYIATKVFSCKKNHTIIYVLFYFFIFYFFTSSYLLFLFLLN